MFSSSFDERVLSECSAEKKCSARKQKQATHRTHPFHLGISTALLPTEI